jgi:hypothetical protein
MMISKKENVKKAMRSFTKSERQYRIIEEERNAQFLNWKKEEGGREKGEKNRIDHCTGEEHMLQVGHWLEDVR